MGGILAYQKLKGNKGFALGYILIIVGAVVAIGGALLASTLAESKQSHLHSKNIGSFYAADSGAEIAQKAFVKYIHNLNHEVSESYTWLQIKNVNNYMEFLNLSPLGPDNQKNKAVFHLNLACENEYYLNYSSVPILNDLGNDTTVETTVTLTSLGQGNLEYIEGEECITYPIKYVVKSQGYQNGAISNNKIIQGEATAFVRFFPGSFSRFALFTDKHESDRGEAVWFNERITYDGPIYTNSSFRFWNTPVFHGRVYQKEQEAIFYNNNRNRNVSLDADSNPPYDMPIFYDGFKRGVQGEELPKHLSELRETNLQHDTNKPPKNVLYHFPQNNNGKLVGGLYLPGKTGIQLLASGNQQTIRTNIARGFLQLDALIDFIIDYENMTTTVYDRRARKTLATYNSIPNGTVFVDSEISSLSGTVHKDSRLTIGAKNTIYIDNHIRYQEDPREHPDARNILGILSENSDVIIPNSWGSAPNNLEIHATIMAPKGSFYLENYRTVLLNKGTLNLLGGVITKYYGGVGHTSLTGTYHGYGRNFVYDKRMADLRKMPLGFPKTDSIQYDTARDNLEDTLELVIWKLIK